MRAVLASQGFSGAFNSVRCESPVGGGFAFEVVFNDAGPSTGLSTTLFHCAHSYKLTLLADGSDGRLPHAFQRDVTVSACDACFKACWQIKLLWSGFGFPVFFTCCPVLLPAAVSATSSGAPGRHLKRVAEASAEAEKTPVGSAAAKHHRAQAIIATAMKRVVQANLSLLTHSSPLIPRCLLRILLALFDTSVFVVLGNRKAV